MRQVKTPSRVLRVRLTERPDRGIVLLLLLSQQGIQFVGQFVQAQIGLIGIDVLGSVLLHILENFVSLGHGHAGYAGRHDANQGEGDYIYISHDESRDHLRGTGWQGMTVI
jgi:hypothetical protein